MKKLLLPLLAILLTAACKKESTLQSSPSTNNSSMDDAVTGTTSGYSWVRIGTQRWMTRNLPVGHYRNGDRIQHVKDQYKWSKLTTGAWCWYNNDSANGAIYGKLYNWYAVNDPRGLAPKGWHVPSNAEWDTLTAFLGINAGGKLKETGTTHWLPPNTGATNETGFTALPGGYRHYSGTFSFIRYHGNWWSSTEDSTDALFRNLSFSSGFISAGAPNDKRNGYSVRCVKD